MWQDAWLTRGDEGSGRAKGRTESGIQMVSELICNMEWNTELVGRVFRPEAAAEVVKIPLSLTPRKDRMYWIHHSTGKYTVKSGYRAAMEIIRTSQGRITGGQTSRDFQNPKAWRSLWNMKIKGKHKFFWWKCLLNILPTGEVLHKRLKGVDPICKRCGEGIETVEHMLFHCSESRVIWKFFPLDWSRHRLAEWNIIDWWDGVQSIAAASGKFEQLELTIILMWQIWKARNGWVFQCSRADPFEVVQRTLAEWRELSEMEKRERTTEDLITHGPNEYCLDTNENSHFVHIKTAVCKDGNELGWSVIVFDPGGR